MPRATAHVRNVAERLIAHETADTKSSDTRAPAAFHVCEKLRPQLANLLGNTGFRTLLARALALTHAEAPWMRAVHVKEDGSLEGLDELESDVGPDELAEGSVVLLAQLLGLLTAFIGDNLTLGIVREAWPKLALEDLDVGKRTSK